MRRTGPAAPILSVVLFFLLALIAQPGALGGGRADDPPECEEKETPCEGLCSNGDAVGPGGPFCCWGSLADPPSFSINLTIKQELDNAGEPVCHTTQTWAASGTPVSGQGGGLQVGPDNPLVTCEPSGAGTAPLCFLGYGVPGQYTCTATEDCNASGCVDGSVYVTPPGGWKLGTCSNSYSAVVNSTTSRSETTATYFYQGECSYLEIKYEMEYVLVKIDENGVESPGARQYYFYHLVVAVSPSDTACCEECEEEVCPDCGGGIADPREETIGDPPIEGEVPGGGGGGGGGCDGSGGPGGGSSGGGSSKGGRAGGGGGGVCTMDKPSSTCPVLLATGDKVESDVDLVVRLPGRDFRVARDYTSRQGFGGAALAGRGWTLSPFRFMLEKPGQGAQPDVELCLSARHGRATFRHDGQGRWSAGGPTTQHLLESTLQIGQATYDTWELVQPGEWSTHYYRGGGANATPADLVGLLAMHGDVYGNSELYEYGSLPGSQVPRLARIYLNGTDVSDSAAVLEFLWRGADSVPASLRGKLAMIRVKRPVSGGDPVVTDEVRYRYAGAQVEPQDLGSVGDLIEVVRSRLVDRSEVFAGASEPLLHRVVQYRYHRGQSPGSSQDERLNTAGGAHQLKMVIAPEQIEYMAQRTGSTVLAAADALRGQADDAWLSFNDLGNAPVMVADMAAKIVDYSQTTGRVAAQYTQSACGCSSGSTQGKKTLYAYFTGTDQNPSIRLTEQELVGGTFQTYREVFHDLRRDWPGSAADRVVTSALIEPNGRRWVWRYEYDENTRLLLREGTPESTARYLGFGESDGPDTGPLWEGHDNAGLVYAYAYDAQNRRTEVRVGRGWDPDAPPQGTGYFLVSRTTYSTANGGAHSHLPAKIERFASESLQDPVQDAGSIETTLYEYGFHGQASENRVAWIRTVSERELESENGPSGTGLTVERHELIDAAGFTRWSCAEDGALTYREYDPRTGALTKLVRNAPKDGSDPGVEELLSGDYGGLSIPTSWGRHAEGGSLTTTYAVDLLGRTTARTGPGGVSGYTIRELAQCPDRSGHLFYAELSLPHKLPGLQGFDGPAVRTWYNASGKAIAQRRYALDAAAGYDPAELEFTLTGLLARGATEHSLSGLVRERRRWSRAGDDTTMQATLYGYDPLGRLETVTTPNGTITRTSAYDVLDRPREVQVGTGLTNMVTVARYYYDHAGTDSSPEQGMGNGHLTLVQLLTGETGTDPLAPHTRTTVRTFDYRGRLIKVANDHGPFEYLVYDNLGRVTARGLFSADPTGGIGSPGRGLYSESKYSQRGLLHRQRVAIDPGDLGEGFLETNTWFDAAGRAVAVWSPNGPGAKTVYDGLGRVTTSYVTDRRNDAAPGAAGNHADATIVSDDRVVEQQELSYTAAGNVQLVTQRRRLHDHTGFGALTGTTGVATFVVYVYDDAQRRIGTLNYGTAGSGNVFASGGSAPSPIPTAVPSPLPADVIVQQVRYNARGLVDEAVDPEGKVTKYFYDDLSRRVAVVENHEDATVTWDGWSQQWTVSGVGGSGTPAETDVDRMTQFVYDASGNLWKQIAHLPGGGAQTTEYVYAYGEAHNNSTDPGDPDVLTGTLVVSNDLLHRVRYPDRGSGAPGASSAYWVSYAYNALGELRSTTDQNGTRHVYVRDGLGRVLQDWVDAFGPGVDDAVGSISVAYDAFGRVDRVRSARERAETNVVNDVRFRYTPLWQVGKVYQDHDGPVQTADSNDPDSAPAGNTVVVAYDYASSPASSGNYSRLATLTYPDGAPVNYGYGTSGGLDDRISRVFSLSVGSGTPVQLARYHRVGMHMAAIVDYPTPDVQLDRTYTAAGNRRFTMTGGGTPAAQGSYAGWDRFGRVSRQAWVDGASGPGSGGLPNRPPVLETAYGYDRASNRLFARDARPGAKLPDRDWQYDYDGLDRLKEAERGVWNGSTLVTGVGGQRWDLDMLGNWTEFRRDLAGNGLYSSVETRDHNSANEIIFQDPDGPGSAPQLPFAYDDAGNMRERERSGGAKSVYTHDAWNRLVKVTTDQTVHPFGSVTLQESEYNGLHWRTVRRLDTTTPANGLDQMRVMHYSASWQVLQEDIDDGYTGTYSPDRRAQQFWGLRYIDDAIARRSKATLAGSYALPWFYVTDAQFSVVAVLNASGKLVERIKYDPYGTASHHWAGDADGDGDEDKSDENLVTASYGSIGSGAYNADADINRDGVVNATDLALVGKNAALAKGMISDPAGPDNAVGYCGYLFNRETTLYTVRFRHYDPALGRWLRIDPAGFVDGMNRWEYAVGNPVLVTDPTGLVVTDPSPDPDPNNIWHPGGPTPRQRKIIDLLDVAARNRDAADERERRLLGLIADAAEALLDTGFSGCVVQCLVFGTTDEEIDQLIQELADGLSAEEYAEYMAALAAVGVRRGADGAVKLIALLRLATGQSLSGRLMHRVSKFSDRTNLINNDVAKKLRHKLFGTFGKLSAKVSMTATGAGAVSWGFTAYEAANCIAACCDGSYNDHEVPYIGIFKWWYGVKDNPYRRP